MNFYPFYGTLLPLLWGTSSSTTIMNWNGNGMVTHSQPTMMLLLVKPRAQWVIKSLCSSPAPNLVNLIISLTRERKTDWKHFCDYIQPARNCNFRGISELRDFQTPQPIFLYQYFSNHVVVRGRCKPPGLVPRPVRMVYCTNISC